MSARKFRRYFRVDVSTLNKLSEHIENLRRKDQFVETTTTPIKKQIAILLHYLGTSNTTFK